MPEPKAQLVDPQGPIDVPGISATGIITATGGFVGAVQGAATGLANTTTNLTVGVVTSTGFVGDVTGTASSVTKGVNLSLGIVTATSFAGDVFGNAAGLSTTTAGLKLGIVSATSFAGNFTGIGSGISGTPHIQAGIMTATSFAGNFTGLASGITGTPNLMVGILTGTAYSGDGSSLTGIAATNWIANNVTANSSTTAIDLALGNVVKFTQTSNTTVSFANTGTSNIVTFIRPGADYTVTWPSAIKWDDGSAPTLNATATGENQVFTLLSRDEGVTWYGWETVNQVFTEKYSLYSWGRNRRGGLGHNKSTDGGDSGANISSPVQIPGLWTSQFSGSYYSSYAIKSNGTLWAWGQNSLGNLGQNNVVWQSSPVQVPGDWTGSTLAQDGSTRGHMVAIRKSDGTLWAMGDNQKGALGQNSIAHRSSPVQIPGTTWDKFDVSAESILATKTDGTLWSWGYNQMGLLGQNDRTNRSSPVQIPGTTWSKPYVFKIGSGAIKTDGTLWLWGYNYYGQLGQSSRTHHSSPVQVPGTTWTDYAVDYNASYGIKTDGTLLAWGDNEFGELGQGNDGHPYQRSSPVQIPGTTWSKVFAGKTASPRAIKTDGTLWGWGHNYYGSGGDNNTTQTNSPVQTPGTYALLWHGADFSMAAKEL